MDDVEFDLAIISEWVESARAYVSEQHASNPRVLSGFLPLGSPFEDDPDQ